MSYFPVEIKVGYVVSVLNTEINTEASYLVCIDKYDKMTIVNDNNWYYLDNFDNDNLTYGIFKLIKIYGRTSSLQSYKASIRGRDVLWERPFETDKKPTLNLDGCETVAEIKERGLEYFKESGMSEDNAKGLVELLSTIALLSVIACE